MTDQSASEPWADSLVILLHGVGSNGRDLAPLGEMWAQRLPRTVFVSPNAPHPYEHAADGYQWFSISGVTEANRPERLVAARTAFDALLTEVIERQGFAGRLDRVALVGFSQGSMMALDAMASGRWSFAGIVAFSGRLSSPPPLTPVLDTPVLLVHGSADPVIPPAETAEAAARLAPLGVKVDSHVLARLGHTISREGALMAERFLADRLGGPAAR